MSINPQLISTILQYTFSSILAFEEALPQSGFGSTKKEIILNGIKTIVKATAIETGQLASAGSNTGTNTEISAIAGFAGEFIDGTVASLKNAKAGPFAASAASATAAAPAHIPGT